MIKILKSEVEDRLALLESLRLKVRTVDDSFPSRDELQLVANEKLNEVIDALKNLMSEFENLRPEALTIVDIDRLSEISTRVLKFYPDHFIVDSSLKEKVYESWEINHLFEYRGEKRLDFADRAMFFPATIMPTKELFNFGLQYGLFFSHCWIG
ncbi:MAG: hypothetical protein R2827_16290 [Bdellovibrionales bacterium]